MSLLFPRQNQRTPSSSPSPRQDQRRRGPSRRHSRLPSRSAFGGATGKSGIQKKKNPAFVLHLGITTKHQQQDNQLLPFERQAPLSNKMSAFRTYKLSALGGVGLKDKSGSKSNTLYYWIPAIPLVPAGREQGGSRESRKKRVLPLSSTLASPPNTNNKIISCSRLRGKHLLATKCPLLEHISCPLWVVSG